jgi:hypothetical protein
MENYGVACDVTMRAHADEGNKKYRRVLRFVNVFYYKNCIK